MRGTSMMTAFCAMHGVRYPSLEGCSECWRDKVNQKVQKTTREYFGELHQDVINDIRIGMTSEEKVEMEAKLQELAATKKFASYDSRLVFEDAFRSGYLATKAKKAK